MWHSRQLAVVVCGLLILLFCAAQHVDALGAKIAVAFKVVGSNEDLIDVTDRISNPDNTFDIFEQDDDYLFIGTNETGWNRLQFVFQNPCTTCTTGGTCNSCPSGSSQCCAIGGSGCGSGTSGSCYIDPKPRQYRYDLSNLEDSSSQDVDPSHNSDDTTSYLTKDGIIKGSELLVPSEKCIPTLMTKWTAYTLWPMYWISYRRREGSTRAFVPSVKTIAIIDSAVMVVSTTLASVSGNIDEVPLKESVTVSNDGTAVLTFSAAFSPDLDNVWSLTTAGGSTTLPDVLAGDSVVLYVTYNPSVPATASTTMTLTCSTCTSGLTKTVAVTGTATVPLHFQNLTIPAAGKYGLGANLVFRAYYDTMVKIDDSRAAIDARLQKNTTIAGAVVASASLSTPINTASYWFDFVLAVDDQVPDNRLVFVTSSEIEPGIITKVSTNIPLTGPNGNAANAMFADPNPTGIFVDGTRPSIKGVAITGGFFTTGQLVTVSANFSEPVVLSGSASDASISVDVQGSALDAVAVSQSGYQTSWSFTLAIPAGVEDRNGVSLLSLVQSGASFRDEFQNMAFSTIPPNFFADVSIDSKPPTISSWTLSPSTAKVGNGAPIVFTAVMSETVEFAGASIAVVVGGKTTNVLSSSVSPSTQISFFFVVPDGADGSISSVTMSYTYVRDEGAGNALSGALTVPSNQLTGMSLDGTAPSVTNVILPGAATFYKNSRLDFYVNFSEAVALEGLVKLVFDIGSTTLSTDDVVAVGGSPRLLLFKYIVPELNAEYAGITSMHIEASSSSVGSSKIVDVQDSGNANAMSLPTGTLPFNSAVAAAIVVNGISNSTTGTGTVGDPASSSSSSSVGGIIGGVVGALVVIGLVFFAFVSWKRYKKYQEEKLPDFQKHAYQLDEKASLSKVLFTGSIPESQKQLRDVMMDCDEMLPYVIAGSVSTAKLNEVVKAIIYLYKCEGREDKALAFIKRCVTVEVQKAMAAGKSNLFRTNNVATKSMAVYLRMIGLPYLWHCIGEVVSSTTMMNVELDPTRVAGGDTDSDLSRYTLLQMTQQQFVSILRKLSQMPEDLRAIARHLDAEVRAAAQGEDGDSLAHVALAGMVFLRYFCPAISAPTAFGFMDERPPADKRRTLTLVTKTLQNLANGVSFGGKEPYMEKLNDFIASNQEKMDKYLADVVGIDVKTTDEIPGPPPPAHARPWALDVLMKVISGNISSFKGKLSPAIIGRLRHILAADLLPLPPKAQWAKSGWMTKQGGGTSMGGKKNWKDRFFVLQGAYLWYMKDEVKDDNSGVKPLGQLCLDGCSVITTNDGFNGFMIDHPHMRTYYIRMEDKAERDIWVSALGQAIDDLRKDQGAGGGADRKAKAALHIPSGGSEMAPLRNSSPAPLTSDPGTPERKGGEEDEADPVTGEDDKGTGSSPRLLHTSSVSQMEEAGGVQLLGIRKQSGRRSVLVAVAEEKERENENAIVNREYRDASQPGFEDGQEEVISKWTTHQTDDGASYYYNTETGETSWERPAELTYGGVRRGSIPESLPPGWVMYTDDDTGLPYYYNAGTGQTVWEAPTQ